MGKRYDGSFIAFDLDSYQRSYEDIGSFISFELGYKSLCLLGNSLDFSFETFYMVLVAIIIVTMLIAVVRIGGNLHLFIASWLIYFVLITMDQLKNQSAVAVLMISVLPFITSKKRSLKHELIALAIASLFHFSFILYSIPLVLTYKKNFKSARLWSIVCLALFFILMATSSSFLNGILNSFVLASDDADKYAGYVGSHTRLSPLLILSIYAVSVFSVYLNYKRNKRFNGSVNKFSYESIGMYIMFMLFACILLPTLLVNTAFYRLFRDLSFIGIAYMSLNTSYKTSTFLERSQVMFFSLLICVGWFVFDIIVKGYQLDYAHYFFNNAIL